MFAKRKLAFILTLMFVSLTFYSFHHYFRATVPTTEMNEGKLKETDVLAAIERKAKTYYIAPQNAYIDRVWKKTPGRNGLQVNIKKSLKRMKKNGSFDEKLLVMEEVPPDISLHELEASPIFRGHPEKEMVALLINVSWGTEYIPMILKVLKEHQIKATFFIEGKWAKKHKDILKMIHEQHHLIGNHAYSHPDMARLSKSEMKEQIEQTNDIIEAIVGERPKWFAPPSGSFNNEVVHVAHALEMETILWTVDTIDWQKPSVSVMINRVMKNIHPGATILMHPTEPVAEGLDDLIKEIKNEKLNISTLEDLLEEKR